MRLVTPQASPPPLPFFRPLFFSHSGGGRLKGSLFSVPLHSGCRPNETAGPGPMTINRPTLPPTLLHPVIGRATLAHCTPGTPVNLSARCLVGFLYIFWGKIQEVFESLKIERYTFHFFVHRSINRKMPLLPVPRGGSSLFPLEILIFSISL